MKPTELRIGNYVAANIGATNPDIRKITAEDLLDFDNGKIEINPVPLTEQWLIHFGFRHVGYYSNNIPIEVMVKDPLFLRMLAKSWTLFIKEPRGWSKIVNYVHELQNLYFTLTGEELRLTHGKQPEKS